MKLARFFAEVAPYLLGKVPGERAAEALFGGGWRDSPDGRRFLLYGGFCQVHRQEAVSLFSSCAAAVGAFCPQGEAQWTALVERYFLAHPMHHFELNQNGAHLPEFLKTDALGTELPFLPQLADFEWWEWQTIVAADEPVGEPIGEPIGEAASGAVEQAAALRLSPTDQAAALRLSPTVELRRYDYDFVAWLDDRGALTDMKAAGPPEARSSYVLFWRQEGARRENASLQELLLLKAVNEEKDVQDPSVLRALAQAAGLGLDRDDGEDGDDDDLSDTLADLREAGILTGGR